MRASVVREVARSIPLILLMVSCQTAPENRRTDWADVTVTAIGIGSMGEGSPAERMQAVQQAKQDAMRQLEEKVLHLQTESGKPLTEQIKTEDRKQKVKAFVRGASIVSMENTDAGVQIETRLFLGDHFKATLGLLPPKDIAAPLPDQKGGF